MFNLDHEIARWRQTMVDGGVSDPAVLDELESHLRDFVAEEVRSGSAVEQAFEAGLERIGQASVLQREFSRANKVPFLAEITAVLADRRKCFWSALVLSVLVAAGFYYWRMQVTPVYQSVVTLQLMQPLPHSRVLPKLAVEENDIQSAEPLNTFIHLLVSGRLRTEVAESLTPAEQQIVRRTTATRHVSDGTESAGDRLGALTVSPIRLSYLVRLSVVHEDAEAAALIVNRYVEQCRLDLRNTKFPGMAFRIIDAAAPARQPFAPNRTQILQASEAIALVTFAGLLLTAAALRKLASMRMTAGREMRTS